MAIPLPLTPDRPTQRSLSGLFVVFAEVNQRLVVVIEYRSLSLLDVGESMKAESATWRTGRELLTPLSSLPPSQMVT